MWLPLILIFALFLDTSANHMRGLIVPQYAFVGGTAELTCSYDLSQNRLYSLKWYLNKNEFYRYVPTERSSPINIQPDDKFILHEISRDSRQVMLKLSELKLSASGEYRCEVIAEHPSFRTEFLSSNMHVLREHLYPPLIDGHKSIYGTDEDIELRCQPSNSVLWGPRPSVKWYINSKMVSPERITKYDISHQADRLGVILTIPAEEVIDHGGTVVAECRLILGNHQTKASKTLRVRMRDFYHNDYFSAAVTSFEETYLLVALFVCLFIV